MRGLSDGRPKFDAEAMGTFESAGGGVDELHAVEPPANILVLAPTMTAGETACPHVGSLDAERVNLLLVSLSGSTERLLGVWRRPEGLPSKIGLVHCGQTRSSAVAKPKTQVNEIGGSTVQVTSISPPFNLTDLGRKIERCLESWRGDGNDIALCFSSVTTLVNLTDLRRTFRFLSVLTHRVDDAGSVAHYHVDPDALTEHEVSTLRPLFDQGFEYDPETEAWRTVSTNEH